MRPGFRFRCAFGIRTEFFEKLGCGGRAQYRILVLLLSIALLQRNMDDALDIWSIIAPILLSFNPLMFLVRMFSQIHLRLGLTFLPRIYSLGTANRSECPPALFAWGAGGSVCVSHGRVFPRLPRRAACTILFCRALPSETIPVLPSFSSPGRSGAKQLVPRRSP